MASVTCKISQSVVDDIKKLRFSTPSQTSSSGPASTFKAYVALINSEQTVVKEELDDVTDFDSLVDELPDHSPRYVVVSYKKVHPDQRVSYPLVFIYYCPETAAPQQRMLYASTQQLFEAENKLGKSLLLQRKEELTQTWLDESRF